MIVAVTSVEIRTVKLPTPPPPPPTPSICVHATLNTAWG